MNKTALDVIAFAFRRSVQTEGTLRYEDDAQAALAALGANGYVVVPRHLLDELLATTYTPASATARLVKARAAVVEAVGPTTWLNRWPGTDEPVDQVGT